MLLSNVVLNTSDFFLRYFTPVIRQHFANPLEMNAI